MRTAVLVVDRTHKIVGAVIEKESCSTIHSGAPSVSARWLGDEPKHKESRHLGPSNLVGAELAVVQASVPLVERGTSWPLSSTMYINKACECA